MTRRELNQQYWRYYLLLEKRFIDTLSYIELNYKNFSAFSDNYALLIQSIGAELDTVFKIYCNYKTSERKIIKDYIDAIEYEENNAVQKHTVNNKFRDQKIIVLAYNLHIQPFRTWNVQSPAQSLKWWCAFNKLKHNRFENRKLANQGNAVNILGALYFLEMKMLKKITEDTDDVDIFADESQLFTLKNWSTNFILAKNGIICKINGGTT